MAQCNFVRLRPGRNDGYSYCILDGNHPGGHVDVAGDERGPWQPEPKRWEKLKLGRHDRT